jgi:phage portal protein BeeE
MTTFTNRSSSSYGIVKQFSGSLLDELPDGGIDCGSPATMDFVAIQFQSTPKTSSPLLSLIHPSTIGRNCSFKPAMTNADQDAGNHFVTPVRACFHQKRQHNLLQEQVMETSDDWPIESRENFKRRKSY